MSIREKLLTQFLILFIFCEIILTLFLYKGICSKKDNFNYNFEKETISINKSGIGHASYLLQKHSCVVLLSDFTLKSSFPNSDFISIDSNQPIEEIDCLWIPSTTRNHKRYYRVDPQLKKKAEKNSSFHIARNLYKSSTFNIFTPYTETISSIFKTHSPPSTA